MILRNHDGKLQPSKMRMLCWENAVLVSQRHLTFGLPTYDEDARVRGCIFHPWL